MRVLIGCEESQEVCKAFRALGHEAYSCDILPCSGGHPEWHFQEDIFKVIDRDNWDMMIAFPPCTHLTVSGARWFKEKRADGRQQSGIDFFMKIINAPIPKIAVENPIGIMSTIYRVPDQIIQPWHFGHGETKATCLWLKNIPPLIYTIISPKREQRIWNMTDENGKKLGWNTEEIKKMRSKTFHGIAKAMAQQWGTL